MVKLWDMRADQCLQTLHKYTSWVWSVAFAPLSSDTLGTQLEADRF